MTSINLPEAEYMTTADAAKALGVNPETIRRMCRAGVLAHTRTFKGHYRPSRYSLMRWHDVSSRPETQQN